LRMLFVQLRIALKAQFNLDCDFPSCLLISVR